MHTLVTRTSATNGRQERLDGAVLIGVPTPCNGYTPPAGAASRIAMRLHCSSWASAMLGQVDISSISRARHRRCSVRETLAGGDALFGTKTHQEPHQFLSCVVGWPAGLSRRTVSLTPEHRGRQAPARTTAG
jgi:hypothetical protein